MVCAKCGAEKTEAEFWHYGQCRECHKAANRAYYAANRDRLTARMKERYARGGKAYRREWYADHREGEFARTKAWKKENPDKIRAHAAINNRTQYGSLQRRPCEVCGLEPTHAHHPDYTKPLDIIWLCPKHHSERHQRQGNERG